MRLDKLEPALGWITTSRTRLPAPAVAQRGLVFRAASTLSSFFGRPEVPDVLSALHKNPQIFWAWLLFASRLMPYGGLKAAEREKIILRTAWNCRSRYEWGQHVDIALSVGVSDEEIVRVTQGALGFLQRKDQALMNACDEIYSQKCLSDTTWGSLVDYYPEKLLIEIMILIGHYEMIAGFLNSTGLILEPAIERQLQAFYHRISV
jgi:alkylhydroperoxidase family enzyme